MKTGHYQCNSGRRGRDCMVVGFKNREKTVYEDVT
jgi:hypothetical protein